MDIDKYKSSNQLDRVFAIIRILSGQTFQGLTTGEIAKAVNMDHGTTTRTVAMLSKLGVTQETKVPGRWRLGPFMVQLALAHQHDLQTVQGDLDEIKQRYSRKV